MPLSNFFCLGICQMNWYRFEFPNNCTVITWWTLYFSLMDPLTLCDHHWPCKAVQFQSKNSSSVQEWDLPKLLSPLLLFGYPATTSSFLLPAERNENHHAQSWTQQNIFKKPWCTVVYFDLEFLIVPVAGAKLARIEFGKTDVVRFEQQRRFDNLANLLVSLETLVKEGDTMSTHGNDRKEKQMRRNVKICEHTFKAAEKKSNRCHYANKILSWARPQTSLPW